MIELKGISKTYLMGKVSVTALKNVSLKIESGEFIAIMGPSGSGKSTLMHILGFLDRPENGVYSLGGYDITKFSDDELAGLRNQLAGFVFQQFHLLARLSALENAELPLIYAGQRHLKEKAQEKLTQVGLGSRVTHQPNELSGGEQQRVAIARSLVNEPLIIFADEPTGNLDTKSEEEIMSLLEKLNQQGKTIIMVTHEQEVAARAKRIIFMKNGEIVSDTVKVKMINKPKDEDQSKSIADAIQKSHLKINGASFQDHLRQAAHAIFSHKMRSILSMLGILIGVAAVIAMLALGEGAKDSIAQRLSALGSNLLLVRPGSSQNRGVSLEAGTVTRFTVKDAEAMATLSEVSRTSASVRGRGQLVYQNKNWNTQVQGVGVDYFTMRAAVPNFGRSFTEEDVKSRTKVALVGKTVVRELFNNQNPIGETLKINRINFTVIGILPEKGSSGFNDDDDIIVIPITTAMYRLLGKQYVDSIDVEVKGPELIDQAQDSVKDLVIRRHHLNKQNEDSFQIRNMAEIQATLESTTKTMSWLLGAIAAISLFVGGIGIMNIMLVSVTERTKEIGLRKSIGAKARDIVSQFLIEAVVMTVIGGLVGIVLGVGAAGLLSIFAGWATKISIVSIIFATLFSIGIGIIFGMRPAIYASRLNPIEALRYE